MQRPMRDFDEYVHKHLTTPQKLWFTAGSLACYAAWFLILTSAHVPAERKISASLLVNQPAHAIALVAVGIPLLSIALSLIVGRIRFEAGLFCALIGLVILPARSGDLRNALLDAGTTSVYLNLALEAALLWAIIAATYWLLGRLTNTGWIALPASAPEDDPDTLGDRLTATVAQAVCTLVLLMLLGQSPVKGQALAAACAAGMLSSMIIHQTYVVRGSIWYISGTMLACAAADVYAWYSPAGFQIAEIRGFLAGATRSLPMHYATLGAAGAIFGYWTSLAWHAAKKPKSTEAPTT